MKTFLWMSSQRSIFVGDNGRTKSFRASLGKFGKNPLHPQKFACSYTYGDIYNHFIHFFSVNREKNF